MPCAIQSGCPQAIGGKLLADPAQTQLLDLDPARSFGLTGTAQQHAAATMLIEQGKMAGLGAAQ